MTTSIGSIAVIVLPNGCSQGTTGRSGMQPINRVTHSARVSNGRCWRGDWRSSKVLHTRALRNQTTAMSANIGNRWDGKCLSPEYILTSPLEYTKIRYRVLYFFGEDSSGNTRSASIGCSYSAQLELGLVDRCRPDGGIAQSPAEVPRASAFCTAVGSGLTPAQNRTPNRTLTDSCTVQ